jgi:hypothetical protein
LNIPIKHTKQKPSENKDIIVENESGQKQHFKSLEAAYRSFLFLSFLKMILGPFMKKHKFLLDLNYRSTIVANCLRKK